MMGALAAPRAALRLSRLATPALRWFCLLLLCAAYLQGGLTKLLDFGGAIEEMRHFHLAPAAPLAAAVLAGELVAALMVLSGRARWLGALWLALFTVLASLVANRYWEIQGSARFMAENSWYEHLGLAGAFLLVAWHDVREREPGAPRRSATAR